MRKESKEFLYELITTPSPTGFEQPVQRVVERYVSSFAQVVERDLHGNLLVGINAAAKRRVMLAGHSDQIGLMVQHVSKDGYLYFAPLGGIDGSVLWGSRVTIHTEKGPIPGIVGKKAIHLQSAEERSKPKIDIDKMFIDIGAASQKEALSLVRIGDPITFELGIQELRNNLITAPGLDDKVGLFVAVEALRLCANAKLSVGMYAVGTVQEEVGLRGAQTATFGIEPEVGIAIDVIHATDNPGHDNSCAPTVTLGGGPCVSRGPNTNPVVEKMLHAAAKKARLAVQTTPASRPLGNDANSMQVSRRGVATAAIGIPNRYMHTQVEVCHLGDIEASAKLLARFVQDITARTDFIPR